MNAACSWLVSVEMAGVTEEHCELLRPARPVLAYARVIIVASRESDCAISVSCNTTMASIEDN